MKSLLTTKLLKTIFKLSKTNKNKKHYVTSNYLRMNTRTFLYSLFIVIGCKSNDKIHNSCNEIESISKGRTIGKISHQYHKFGCSTVIILKNKQIIVPINNLNKQFDVDGLDVSFIFHPSRKAQTKECMYGIPVIINELKKIKL